MGFIGRLIQIEVCLR